MITLLIVATIQTSLLVGGGLMFAALLRRRSAAARHSVLSLAVAAALAAPLVQAAWPVLAGRPESQWTTRVVEAGVLARLNPPPSDSTVGALARQSRDRLASAVASARQSFRRTIQAIRSRSTFAAVAVGLWLIGAGGALAGLCAQLWRLRRLSRRLTAVGDPRLVRLAGGVAHAHGVRRPVALLTGPDAAIVATWGVWRPRVVVPRDAAQWSDARCRIVFAHEIAHISRRDWAIHLAAAILGALQWFNPILWIAERKLRRESECACDDLVLAGGVGGTEYAGHLLELARGLRNTRRPLAWSAMEGAIAPASSLEGRVHAMLSAHVNRAPLTRPARAAAAAAFVAITLAAIAMGRPAAAQTGIGSLSGVVYDPSGGLLPSVTVDVAHVESGRTSRITTDRTGAFALRDVTSGTYELTMRLPGFATVRASLDLQPGDILQRSIILPLGTIEETITVVPGDPGVSPAAAPPRARSVRDQPPLRGATAPGAVGGNIRVPRMLARANPAFPPELAGSSAVVTVTGRIGIDGFLIDLKDVSDTRPHPAFVASLLTAARQWEFTPTLLNGGAVEANITITCRFTSR